MKRRLLMLLSALCIGVMAWAQTAWDSPTIPSVDLDSYDGTSAVAIYNVKADAFMGEGMNYGTEAIACRLEGGYAAALAGRQKFTLTVAGGTVKMVHNNHADRGVGCASATANDIYADYASNNEWTYAASANYSGAYTLTLDGFGTLDVESRWGGKLTTIGGYGYTDWAFIYESNLTNGSFAKYIERRAMYNVYNAVVNKALYATALNTARTTYVNAGASATDIRNATRTLIKAVASGINTSVDVSALFTNANMQQDGVTGWTNTDVARNAGVIEKYHAAITLSQNKTDIPKGRYDFIFRGMQRQDGTAAAPTFRVQDGNTNPVGTASVPFMADLASTWDVRGGADWAGIDHSQIPDKMWRAAEGLAYEEACAKIKEAVIDDNSVTMTVTESATDQWFVFNSFEVKFKAPYATTTNGTGLTALQWYAIPVNTNGQYTIKSSGTATLYYTQTNDGTEFFPDFSTLNNGNVTNATSIGPLSLSVGYLYVLSTAGVTLTLVKQASTGGNVTELFLVNADFGQSEPTTTNSGWASNNDATYVDGWTGTAAGWHGSAVFSYGSTNGLCATDATPATRHLPPTTGPEGSNGKCLGLGVAWDGGTMYYQQQVTLPAGTYQVRTIIYNAGTNRRETTNFGWYPDGGTAVTLNNPTTLGSWQTIQTAAFNLTTATTGYIRIGCVSSANSGEDNHAHLFIDRVEIISTRWLEENVEVTNITNTNNCYTFYAGEKGVYTLSTRQSNTYNNNAYTYYANTTKTDALTTSSYDGRVQSSYPNQGYATRDITVEKPGFIRVLIANRAQNIKIALKTNSEAQLGDAVAALDANLAGHVTQCNASNFDALVNSGDKVFILCDAKEPLTNTYTMQIANGKSTDRPTYGAINNPLAIVGQVWRIESDGYGAYSFRTYRNGRYFKTGTAGYDTSTGAEPSWYVANVMNRNFHFRSVTKGGNINYVGPWSDSGGVDLTTDPGDGYNNVAANKSLAKAPGFLVFAIDRATYEAYRMYSGSLKAAGWKVVSKPSELGKSAYEYILLDANENGVETGYIMEGGTTGRPHYRAHSSGREPSDLRKWWMAPYGENGGYTLQNVENDYFLSVTAGGEQGWNSGFTNNLADATVKDFLFTPVEGQWTLSNSLAPASFGGRWANKVQDPLESENIAFNKNAGAGKRRFIIMCRPAGNLGLANYDEQGWERITSLPADPDQYFYAYYSKRKTGLGLRLAHAGEQDGNTMVYTTALDPNTNKAGVWTLNKHNHSIFGDIVINTNITMPNNFLQEEWNGGQFYRTNNNGAGDSGWGSIRPTYSLEEAGWIFENENWREHEDYDTDYRFMGAWYADRADYTNQPVAFNKTDANLDYYDIFAISRGKYVTQDIGDRQGTHDISYIINNAQGEQRNTQSGIVGATGDYLIGWKQIDANGNTVNNAFWVQTNDQFPRREGFYIEAWDDQPLSDRMLYQEYTDMPDGFYTLTVKTNLSGTSGAYLFLNGEQVDLGESAGATGLATITARISSGHLKFGVKVKNSRVGWVALDKFTLSYGATNDITTDYFANPSFELKNDAQGYLMGWTLTNNSTTTNSKVQSVTSNDAPAGILSGVDGDKFFNTQDASKTLGIRTTSIAKLPTGSYRISARIAAIDGTNVEMKVFAGDAAAGTIANGDVLNTTTYFATTDNTDGVNGANTSIRNSVLFTLDQEKYITVYFYNTTGFFKLDNLRLISGGHTANIAEYILPNPSFEYADAFGTPANPEVVYSTMQAINNLGNDVNDSGIFGWDISDMDMDGGVEQRVAIGADYSLSYYSYIGDDDYAEIPTAAHGEKYFYNGQYRRNYGGNQTYTMKTTSMGTIPAGTYIANIKYKAVTSFAAGHENQNSPYTGTWPLVDGEHANLTFTVKDASTSTTLATISSNEFMLINREHGNGTYQCWPPDGQNWTSLGWVGGRQERQNHIDGGWNKLSLIWLIEEPTEITFELTEQLRQCYGVDILIDDLRLVMMNVPEEPENCAASITTGTEYYLMNAATGQFLMGDNENGTHAALVPHGMPFKVEGSKLKSYVYGSETNCYLTKEANGTWMDQAGTNFTFTSIGDGKFTIKNGTKYLTATGSRYNRINADMLEVTGDPGLLSQWYMISKADRENNMLSENAKEMDGTFYIPNASFSREMNTEWNINRWALPVRTEGTYDFNITTNVAEAYHKPFHTWKTIAVPNGTYKLRAQGCYRNDGTDTQHLPEFYVNNESTPLSKCSFGEMKMSHDANDTKENVWAFVASSFVEGKYYTDYVTVEVENNLLTVGMRLDVNENLWVIWDNIEMELVSSNNPSTSDFSNITAITGTGSPRTGGTMQMAANIGLEGGQWTPYTITQCIALMDSPVIDQGFPKSYDKIASYFNSLKNIEFANAFYRGSFAEYRNYDAKTNANYRAEATGWSLSSGETPTNCGVVGVRPDEPAYNVSEPTNSGLSNIASKKALYIGSGYAATYGNTEGYEMPLLGGVTYTLSFKYGGWGGTSRITLTGLDGDGSTALRFKPDASTASLGWAEGTSTNSGSSAVRTDNTNAWKTFTATFTPEHDGNCTLTFTGATVNSVIADLELHPHSMDVPADTYYIYNVGAAKYLTSGGANGISATLTQYGGLDVGVASYHSGMSFDTGIYASNESHYMANRNDDIWGTLRCDTVQSVWYAADAGTIGGLQAYYLYNASHKYLRNDAGAAVLDNKPTSFPASDDFKWVLKTYENRVDEMKALVADGLTTIDATFLLPGANFSYRDSRINNWHVAITKLYTGVVIDPAVIGEANYERTDVVIEDGGNNTYTTNGDGYTQVRVGGFNENYVMEAWQHGLNMYQDITGKDGVYLPHGIYTLSAQCADSYTYYPRSYLYVADKDNDIRFGGNAYAYDSTYVKYYDLAGHPFLPGSIDLHDNYGDNKATAYNRSLSKLFLDEANDEYTTGQKDDLRVAVNSFVFGDSDDDTHDNPATFRVGIRQNEYGFHGASNAADGAQWLVFDNFRLTYRPFFDDSNNATDLKFDSDTIYHETERKYLTNIDKVVPYNDAPFHIPANDAAYVRLTQTEMENVKKLTSGNTDKELRDTYLEVRKQLPIYMEDAQVEVPSLEGDPRFALVSKAEGYNINANAQLVPIDWTNKAMTIRGAYGATGNELTMAYDGTYDTTNDCITTPYPSAFTFTPTTGTNCFTLSYKDYNGNTRYLCRGKEIGNEVAWADKQIRTTATAGDALIFRVIPQTTADGIWYLKNTHVGDEDKTSARVNLLGNSDNSVYTANKNYALRIIHGGLSLPVEVKEGYDYSTVIMPFRTKLPEAITAWTITDISDGEDEKYKDPETDEILSAGTIIMERVPYISNVSGNADYHKTQLEACKPYLICAPEEGEAKSTKEIYNDYGAAYTAQDNAYGYYSDFNTSSYEYGSEDIFLVGALEGGQALGWGLEVPKSGVDGYNTYLLTKRNGEVKFYQYYTSSTTAYCAANKTFLRVNSAIVSATKGELIFPDRFWDMEDTVDETTGEPVYIVGIYNVRGVKVPSLQKGLNIIKKSDGSTVKVMVK